MPNTKGKRLTYKQSIDGHEDVGLCEGVTVLEAICKLADYEEAIAVPRFLIKQEPVNEDLLARLCDGPIITSIGTETIIPIYPPAEAVIPIDIVKGYLLGLIDEWNNLGDRKYELPNMQVYNHIRKELDDLEEYICKHFPNGDCT